MQPVDDEITAVAVVTAPDVLHVTSGRRIAIGTLYNLMGLGLPLVAAVVATPILIRQLGIDRYAVLSIMWMAIGYASLFDLGLSRTLTKVVSQKLASSEEADIPGWSAMGLLMMLALGVVGGFAIGLAARPLFGSFMNVPTGLQQEVIRATLVMAIGIPFVVLSAGLRGIVEAYQDFRLVGFIRVVMGVYLIICPLFTAAWNPSLVLVATSLVAGRAISTIVYFWAAAKHLPSLNSRPKPTWSATSPLLSFGGWITVSSIVGPFMVTLDRVIIGAILTVSAVAYYTTAIDLVMRLLIIVTSLSAVLFPTFSGILATAPKKALTLYRNSVATIKVMLFPMVIVLIIFAQPLLTVWLGDEFAANAALPLQILAVGVFLNGQAISSINLVQGGGRPDLTAKLHIVELILFIPALWLLTSHFGIVGSALAWSARMLVDLLALSYMAQRFIFKVPRPLNVNQRDMGAHALMAALLAASFLGWSMQQRFAYTAAALAVFAILAWNVMFSAPDRVRLVRFASNLWHDQLSRVRS